MTGLQVKFFYEIATTENLLPHMPLEQDIAVCLITSSNSIIFEWYFVSHNKWYLSPKHVQL